jgi:colanic acid biosynthesis glycosyl transferase WcaI
VHDAQRRLRVRGCRARREHGSIVAESATRIVFLNEFYTPARAGTAQLLQDLAEDLAAAGHSVTVVCGNRTYPDAGGVEVRRESIGGVRVERVRTTGFRGGGAAGRLANYCSYMAGAALRLLFMRRPDAVVSLTSPPMVPLLGLAAARLQSARAYNWAMDLYPDLAFALGYLRPGSFVGRTLSVLSRIALRHSDCVVAIGDAMARRLTAAGARRVVVIHEWSDGQAIRPRPVAGHALRKAWGWDGRFVILYSGVMGLAHEFDTALAAAERLQDRPEVHWVFIGAGARRDDVERDARRRGLGDVEFRPLVPRERIGDTLTAADVHLVTLRDQVAGMLVPGKIYGILAAGRPCLYVGPAGCEVARLLDEGRCGVRVAVGDDAGLAAAISRYLGDEPRRMADGQRARRLFDERFDRPRAMAAFRRLLTASEQGR